LFYTAFSDTSPSQTFVIYLCCRFSPLWQPASQALGQALTSSSEAAWPLLLSHISHVQQLFLSGQGSSTAEAELDAESAAAVPRQQQDLTGGLTGGLTGFDLQQQWQSYCQKGYGVAAAASGSCTDAANRLMHILKGLAGAASPEVLNRVSADWVPLLLAFAAAVTHGGAAEEAGEDEVQDEAAAAAAAAAAEDTQTAAAAAASEDVTIGAKRKQPEPAAVAAGELAAAEQQQQQQSPAKRQRGSGLAAAMSREGLGALGFSIRAWRGVMMEWLALLGALKNPKKQQRWVTQDCCAFYAQ
jgi:U3 small nucleolar RNA-associated protein 20